MSYWRTDAIALRVLDWRETSYITHWFTRERGKVAAVAKGAKRRGSKFFGAIEPLVRADLVLFRRKGKTGLHTLSELEVCDTFRGARMERHRLSAALYVLEWLRELSAEEDPQPRLFDLAVRALERISRNRVFQPLTVIVFELLALEELGFAPRFETCVVCGSRLEKDAPAVHVAELGGAVCRRCAPGRPRGLALPARVRGLARRLARAPEQAGDLRLEGSDLEALRIHLDAYVAALRGRPLRLARHLHAAIDAAPPPRLQSPY